MSSKQELTSQKTINSLPHTELVVHDGFVLKMIDMAEVDSLVELVNECQPYIAKYLAWARGEYGRVQAEDFLKKIYKERADGSNYGFGIYVDGQLAGHAAFHVDGFEKQPEIGYWIAQKFAGKGYTTEATKALIDLGFDTINVDTIVLRTRSDNPASQRVAEKSGFTFEKNFYDEEQEHEACLFRIDKAQA